MPMPLEAPIRVFFTGLLAVRYNDEAQPPRIEVGIQHDVAGHKLRITILERAPSHHPSAATLAPYAGLPTYLDASQGLDWDLHVDVDGAITTGDILDNAVVLDGPGFHPGILLRKPIAFPSRFTINTGTIYAAIGQDLEKSQERDSISLFFRAAVSIGVNVHFDSKHAASLTSNSEVVFRFSSACEYDVYVSCLPDYVGSNLEVESAANDISDFQYHYRAFTIPEDQWYDVRPDPTLTTEKVGLNFAHPCIPIFLSETNI